MLATIPHDACTQLTDAVSALACEPIDGHTTHALGDDLVAIRREIDRLEAQFIRRMQRFDHHHGALAEGAPSTVSWARATCGLTGSAAAERVRMARMLDHLPKTSESFAAGRSPFANVSLIARLAGEVGADATRDVEETLVTAAEKVDPGRMRQLAVYTRHRIDADGVLDQDNRNYERRWVALDQTFDGVFILRGQLDAEGGAVVKAALDATSAPFGPDDRRTGSQRRADGLVDIASGALRSGDLPSTHGQRPHLILTATLDALRRVPGAPPPEVEGVGPINVETARRLACDASRRDAVAGDAAGRGVHARAATGDAGAATGDPSYSIGRARRTVPPAMRTAVGLRDRGCRYPGCDRPLAWTTGHHIEHWADLGPTEVPNLLSLCRFHHRAVHEEGRVIRLLADGSVEVSEAGARDPTPFHRRE